MTFEVPAKTARGQKAIDVVGWNAPGNLTLPAADVERDYIASLACFLPEAQPLVDALRSPPVKEGFRLYAEADRRAIEEQSLHIRDRRWATAPGWFTVLAAMMVVIFPPGVMADVVTAIWSTADRDEVVLSWRTWSPWIVYLGLVSAPLFALWRRPERSFAAWQQTRATAEAMRQEIFRRLLDFTPSPSGQAPMEQAWPLRLKLEFFRRWQVELQHEFFKKRGSKHAHNVRRKTSFQWLLVAALVLVGFVLLASSLSGYEEQGMPPAYLRGPLPAVLSVFGFAETMRLDYWLLALGALAAIVLGHFIIVSDVTAAKRNAPRYDCMRENFASLLNERLERARAAADVGDERGVREYFDRVHAAMSAELNDWVRLADLDQGRDKHLSEASGSGGVSRPDSKELFPGSTPPVTQSINS